MFPNRLTNQRFNTPTSVRIFYQWFIHELWEFTFNRGTHFNRNHDIFVALKLISEQYLMTRKKIQDFTNLHDLLEFINTNQLNILNVPLNMVDYRRNPKPYIQIDIVSLDKSYIDSMFQHLGEWEEPIQGEGWEGDMKIYIPQIGRIFDDKAIRVGLASYGIYLFDIVYGYDRKSRFLNCRFAMLKDHFNLTINKNITNDSDEEEDDCDDLEYRIWEIEEGFSDNEDPRI